MNKFFCSNSYNYLIHKKVSVMATIRSDINNIDLIVKMISNIFTMCSDPDSVEMLIRMDDDDSDVILLSQSEIFNKYNVKLYVGFRHGYTGMSKYWNELFFMSVGDILCMWGNDISILTNGWDSIVSEHIGKVAVIQLGDLQVLDIDMVKGIKGCRHPVVTRPLLDILGDFAPIPCADCYYNLLGEISGIIIECDVDILYLSRIDNEGASNQWEKFNSEENKTKLTLNTIKIGEYLSSHNIPQRTIPYFFISFNPIPMVELKGGLSGYNYSVEFINSKNNFVIHSGSLQTYQWLSAFASDFVPWIVRITNEEGKVVYENNFSLSGEKVMIKMGGDNTEELLCWLPFIEQFRNKYNCKIVCLTVYPELFGDMYDGIEFRYLETHISDDVKIYAFYKLEPGMDNMQIIKRLGLN